LLGVEFTLTQTHVFDPTIADGQLIEAKTTDANGEIVRENLEYRTYEIFETVAPDGDRMLTVPIEVTVGDEIGHPAITVNNPKAG